MKHPFQVGDLVRHRHNHTNIGIVTRAYKKDGEFYLDTFWLRSKKETKWFSHARFELISRGAE